MADIDTPLNIPEDMEVDCSDPSVQAASALVELANQDQSYSKAYSPIR